VVVGSAVVSQIAQLGRRPDMVARVAEFAASLAQAVKNA
jgi:tryptophan synthase alpha subunit